MTPTPPRLVALCGHPMSGKTTAAEILRDTHGYMTLDDGAPLRQIAMDHFGLSWNDVNTQKGKLGKIDVAGEVMTVRDLLGRIGKGFESEIHKFTLPHMCFSKMNPHRHYVMGSVRRDQAWFWKSKGAVIIEIVNPDATPSPYDFDWYDETAVDHRVLNDGLAQNKTRDQAMATLSARLSYALLHAKLRKSA